MPRSFLFALVLAGTIAALPPSAGAASESHAAGGHIIVTSDELKWVAGPASFPAGAKMALVEGDPRQSGPFTMRIKLPDGFRIAPHWHPADEHVTVLEGTFLIGTGDRWEPSKTKALPAGGFMMMPKGHHHFAGAQGETTIQLHGVGPWQINYLNPADDPRRKAPATR